jgi:hypothetical protein
MTRAQVIASTTALLAALSVAVPDAAQAGSLLSGYGAPGQGNQAILGSALLNGPRSGGGSGGSAGGSDSGLAESPSQEAASIDRGPAEVPHATASKHGSTAGGRGGRASGASRGGTESKTDDRSGVAGASGGTSGTYPASERGEAARLASDGSETLGLSVQDLLYILLALGVLAFTGVLTTRLTGFTVTRKHG